MLWLLIALCGPVPLKTEVPHAQSAEEASAPAEDIARLPNERATDRLVHKHCSRDGCIKEYESRGTHADGTVTIIENGTQIQILPRMDQKPK